MADKKNAYGIESSDTSFRRTWDREEYAAKAAAREAREKEEGKARYEAKLAGKKYHAPPPRKGQDGDEEEHEKESSYTDARAARLDMASQVGKTQMLSMAQAGIGKRGKGAGFYCDACDLTFKDNLQWVEHLNSKGHLVSTGQTGEVRRAGVEEVRERLASLKRKQEELAKEREGEGLQLKERLKIREAQEEEERERRRQKRREKRRKGGDEAVAAESDVKMEDAPVPGADEDDMAKMMGFGGFGTTKV